MPRIFDYSKSSATIGLPFGCFSEPICGKRELSYYDWNNWEPGIFPPNSQFNGYIYDNDKINEIFRWIEENLKGTWFWYENDCNHGHSLQTRIWFEIEEDIMAFKLAWMDLFD